MRTLSLVILMAVAAGAQQSPAPPRYDPPLFKGEKKGKEKDEEKRARTVHGVIRDQDENGVEGAIVQLKDMKSLQVRSFITKEGGEYRFNGLSPTVEYQLKADRPGSSSGTKTISVYDARKDLTINLKLEPKK